MSKVLYAQMVLMRWESEDNAVIQTYPQKALKVI